MQLSSIVIAFSMVASVAFAATPSKLACLLKKGTSQQCYIAGIERSGCPNFGGSMKVCETPRFFSQCSVCFFEDSGTSIFEKGKASIKKWCDQYEGVIETYDDNIKLTC